MNINELNEALNKALEEFNKNKNKLADTQRKYQKKGDNELLKEVKRYLINMEFSYLNIKILRAKICNSLHFSNGYKPDRNKSRRITSNTFNTF